MNAVTMSRRQYDGSCPQEQVGMLRQVRSNSPLSGPALTINVSLRWPKLYSNTAREEFE
jgi:hypothetical protein